MARMNEFLGDHRESFKSFVDDICTLPASAPCPNSGKSSSNNNDERPPSTPTAYSTPLAIRNRLPLTSREGFPSLPYLIDQGREFASLVELWLQGTAGKDGAEGIATAIGTEDGDLLGFHVICTELNARTQECLARAERAERPNSNMSFRWEELIDQLQHTTGLGPASRPESKEGYTEEEEEEEDDDDDDSMLKDSDLDLETPTRESFDDAAMRAAGEAAARSRGFPAHPFNGHIPENAVETDSRSVDDFRSDRDGGAATVAASIMQREHSNSNVDRRAAIHFRGSFDMNNPGNVLSGNSSLASNSGGSGAGHSGNSAGPFLPRDATTSSFRDRLERDREIARDIEQSLTGKRNAPVSNSRVTSAHGSVSGSAMSSETDSNATTALPSWTREKERREREKEKLKKREKEEREKRLKDFVPLATMVGGFRGRRKDRKDKEREGKEDKDRERKDGGSGPSD